MAPPSPHQVDHLLHSVTSCCLHISDGFGLIPPFLTSLCLPTKTQLPTEPNHTSHTRLPQHSSLPTSPAYGHEDLV